MKVLFALVLLFTSPLAHATATLLPPALETETIQLIEGMAPDSWNEGDIDIRVNAVLFDAQKQMVIVIYSRRELHSRKPFEKQKPVFVPGIRSLKEIVDQAPNGFRSLNLTIADTLLDEIN